MISNEMYDVHFQPIREIFIKISILQNSFINEDGNQVRRFKKIGEIQGNATDGVINLSASSPIRRSCSIDMVVTDSSFFIGNDKKIWLDKWFKLEIGIKSLKTDKIIWFNKGMYAINKSSIKYNALYKTLHIEGLDLMCTLDGTLGGVLDTTTKIDVDTPIVDAIKTTVLVLGKISKNNIYIEPNNLVIPYDIEKQSTDSVYSILEEIRDLYMDWEFLFDENGRFIYQKVKNRYFENNEQISDLILFSFLENNDLISDYTLEYDFDNVKNKIIVYGTTLENGIQIKAEKINDNPESPFNINTDIGVIPFAYVDEKIFNEEQAEQRANYEYIKHNNFNERVSVELTPIYFLDVNRLVEFNKPEINLQGRFLIDSITIPLNYNRKMTFSTYKIYPISQ